MPLEGSGETGAPREWAVKFIESRIKDPIITRMVRRMLKAGTIEEYQFEPTEEGSEPPDSRYGDESAKRDNKKVESNTCWILSLLWNH